MRSVVTKFFLTSLFHASDCNTVLDENEAIFGRLVEELNLKGIEMCIDGKIQQIYFVMSLLTGDNEGLNTLVEKKWDT